MADIEKVIKALEDFNKNRICLPHLIPWDEIADALALLKKQEAVEPNPVHNSFRWFACGKCDCSITIEDRFCPRCGLAVKWEPKKT